MSSTNQLLGYPPEARLLILNRDDFGMCHAINNEERIPEFLGQVKLAELEGAARVTPRLKRVGRSSGPGHRRTAGHI